MSSRTALPHSRPLAHRPSQPHVPRMKPLFWYVVKSPMGYLDPGVDWWPEQGLARPFVFRSSAKHARDEYAASSGRVVLVHARLPRPKLPDWMTPTPLKPRQFVVTRVRENRVWEWIFAVSDSGSYHAVETVCHSGGGAEVFNSVKAWKPDVGAEAAQRAAHMLRAQRKAAT